MSFSLSRKTIKQIKSTNLRGDFEDVTRQIEQLAGTDKELAGKYLSSLIRMAISLRHSLPKKARITLVNNLIEDALKSDVPHQFEREEDRECNLRTGLCVPKLGTTCIRDTWINRCIGSG